jgi:hypothetical protein
MARIEEHPAVARAIPAITISPLSLVMPLIRDDSPLEAYGVTPGDMAYLVDLYALELAEGHLPRPAGNEIVIPWTAAKNRDLQVGDVIGDPERPIYPGAPTLPTPLLVSGIFAPAEKLDEEVWLSFISRQFIDDNRERWPAPLSLLVVPRTGQKETVDAWLESEIAGEDRIVLTHGKLENSIAEAMNVGLFAISLMESIIALVAAVALAGLNYIFVTQRKAEFGVLNALGFSRRQLVWRVTHETAFITGIAWLLGVLGCAAVLAYLHYDLYAPGGYRLDFFNLTPWLYTLPAPVSVLLVSAAAVSRAISRLDPVAVIERR